MCTIYADRLRAAFARDGWVTIRRAVEPATMESLMAQIARELEAPSIAAESGEASASLDRPDTWPSGGSRRVLEVTPPGDAAHWAELVASRPVDGGGGERKPDSTGTARWHEALAPWGLTLAAAGAVGGGGRGLVTTRSFKRGEVLMRVTPAVAVVSGRHLSSRCHHSHATGGRLLVCSRCGCARYCSADHQRAAWAGHRDECALLAQTRPRVPGQTVRLLARLLALLRRSAGAPPPEDAGEWARSAAAILSLSHQLGGQPAERCAEFGEQAGMVCSLIQEAARSGGGWAGSSSCPPQEQVASLHSLLSLNAHAICDAELQARGSTCRGSTCRGSTCRQEVGSRRGHGPKSVHGSG